MTTSTPSSRLDEATLAQSRADQTRAAAVSLVQALYRLVKASQLHAETNEAVASLVRFTQESVSDYCQKAQVQVATLHFTRDTVFINGQMLRAARQSYQCAAELAAMLEKGGASEISIPMAVAGADTSAFARAVIECSRDQSNPGRLADARLGGIRLRKAKLESVDAESASQESTQGRILKTYASAVVVMRELHEQLRRGDVRLPHRIKRIAQRLIAHAEEDVRTLVSLAGGKAAEADAATRAVNTAILAIAMARQLTRERPLLTALTMSALLLDAGRLRLEEVSRPAGAPTVPGRRLNDDELEREPASSVVMLTALGRIHPPSMTRVAIAYEALELSRATRSGIPRQGRRPDSVLARVLYVARRFLELTNPPHTEPPVSFDDAIQQLESEATDASGRLEVRLLLGALGFFPPGTLVELNTGEMAVVLSVPSLPVDYARPKVRILYDARNRMIDPPRDVDLSAVAEPGEPLRCLRRLVEADADQMKQMRAYVDSVGARTAPAPSPGRPAPRRVVPDVEPTIVDVIRSEAEPAVTRPRVAEGRGRKPALVPREDPEEAPRAAPVETATSRPKDDRLASLLAEYLDDD